MSTFKHVKNRKNISDDNKREVAPFPSNALIELTNSCNHSCVFCKNPYQTRKGTYLDKDVLKKFVKEGVANGLKEVGFYATGEPFMVKNLHDYISIAKNAGISRVYITTNGALATLENVKKCFSAGLDSIKLSINAANQEDYKLVHGHDDFDTVVKNIQSIHAWVKKEDINLQMIASCVLIPSLSSSKNYHEKIFSEYFSEIRYVDSGSQGGQAFDLIGDINETSISLESIFNNFKTTTNSEIKVKPCYMLWDRVHLTAEGYITSCCVDYELDLVVGDTKTSSIAEIWNGKIFKGLRSKHIAGDFTDTLCHQCLYNKKHPYKPLMEVEKRSKNTNTLRHDRNEVIDRIIKLSKNVKEVK